MQGNATDHLGFCRHELQSKILLLHTLEVLEECCKSMFCLLEWFSQLGWVEMLDMTLWVVFI